MVNNHNCDYTIISKNICFVIVFPMLLIFFFFLGAIIVFPGYQYICSVFNSECSTELMLSICQNKCWEECYYDHIYMEMVDVKNLNSEMAVSRDHDS